MSKNIYHESNRFSNTVLFLYSSQFIFFILYTLKNKDDKDLIYYAIGAFILGLLLFFMRLKISITPDQVKYSLIPFTKKSIELKDINKIEVVKISALEDFLGWGIRYSKKYGWAYIIGSDYALLIEKKNGKKVTISIKDKDSLELFLTENKLINPLHNIV